MALPLAMTPEYQAAMKKLGAWSRANHAAKMAALYGETQESKRLTEKSERLYREYGALQALVATRSTASFHRA